VSNQPTSPDSIATAQDRNQDKTLRNALVTTAVVTGFAVVIALLGWRLFEFDPALTVYAQALIAALALTVYRFTIWVHRPSTSVIYREALQQFRSQPGKFACLTHVAKRCVSYFALNQFVWKRGIQRWAAHWPIMVGCLMALAVVVPLIFGWVWFETPADDFHKYKVMLFGMNVRTVPVDGIEAFLAFHGLVWAAFPVIVGTSVALWRRMRDRGDQAVQSFGNDFAPLLILLAIAITGLLMTISYSFLEGWMHAPLAKLHMLIVVGTLLWLPFSKLFHIPQRSLKLAHMVYNYHAERGPAASCARCGDAFASAKQVADLIEVQQKLGYAYELSQTADHYQHICPKCRRASLVIAQSRRWTSSGDSTRELVSSSNE